MDAIFGFGFTAAVLGGLDSPAGSVAGGLLLGVGLSYVSGYLGANFTSIFAMGLLILILMLRPAGIFSGTSLRRV
jgi:branched-chain amino acid transport system permease protein